MSLLAFFNEAHEDQAKDAEKGDVKGYGMVCRLYEIKDVITLVSSIEIPLPDSPDSLDDENDELFDDHNLALNRLFHQIPKFLIRIILISTSSISQVISTGIGETSNRFTIFSYGSSEENIRSCGI